MDTVVCGCTIPADGAAWTVVQDHVNPNLLFVGTEYGLSFTVDGGQHWVRIKTGLPPVPIRDLEIQKRESDLAADSFGRGFSILNDYSLLRQISHGQSKRVCRFIRGNLGLIEPGAVGVAEKVGSWLGGKIGAGHVESPFPILQFVRRCIVTGKE